MHRNQAVFDMGGWRFAYPPYKTYKTGRGYAPALRKGQKHKKQRSKIPGNTKTKDIDHPTCDVSVTDS